MMENIVGYILRFKPPTSMEYKQFCNIAKQRANQLGDFYKFNKFKFGEDWVDAAVDVYRQGRVYKKSQRLVDKGNVHANWWVVYVWVVGGRTVGVRNPSKLEGYLQHYQVQPIYKAADGSLCMLGNIYTMTPDKLNRLKQSGLHFEYRPYCGRYDESVSLRFTEDWKYIPNGTPLPLERERWY